MPPQSQRKADSVGNYSKLDLHIKGQLRRLFSMRLVVLIAEYGVVHCIIKYYYIFIMIMLLP